MAGGWRFLPAWSPAPPFHHGKERGRKRLLAVYITLQTWAWYVKRKTRRTRDATTRRYGRQNRAPAGGQRQNAAGTGKQAITICLYSYTSRSPRCLDVATKAAMSAAHGRAGGRDVGQTDNSYSDTVIFTAIFKGRKHFAREHFTPRAGSSLRQCVFHAAMKRYLSATWQQGQRTGKIFAVSIIGNDNSGAATSPGAYAAPPARRELENNNACCLAATRRCARQAARHETIVSTPWRHSPLILLSESTCSSVRVKEDITPATTRHIYLFSDITRMKLGYFGISITDLKRARTSPRSTRLLYAKHRGKT